MASRTRFPSLAAPVLAVLLGMLQAACLGPKYVRPTVPVPDAFRGAETAPVNASGKTYGDLCWEDIFKDETLRRLIRRALEHNPDVRLAAERIEEARASLRITRSAQYPTATGAADFQAWRDSGATSGAYPGAERTTTSFESYVQAVFELDFWGRLKRSTEAARAQLLATEEARRTVALGLVAEVATAYFGLREMDLELEISRKTLSSRLESLTLVKARQEGGVATLLDEDQAQGLVDQARTTIAGLERQAALQENYLCVLLGSNPGDIPRGKPVAEQMDVPEVPPGLPSGLLERRPDIRRAEQDLIAANAGVAVARAEYFPKFTLTGAAGTLSEDFNRLFSRSSLTWSVMPQLSVPVFNAGKVKAGVRQARSRYRQALITYEQTILQAFREVADALVGYAKLREYRRLQASATATLADQARLSNLRYTGGVTSYLEVLDSERQYFSAQLSLAQAVRDEFQALVYLYKVLGGGWKAAASASRAPAPSTGP